jgi:hypothetical protein
MAAFEASPHKNRFRQSMTFPGERREKGIFRTSTTNRKDRKWSCQPHSVSLYLQDARMVARTSTDQLWLWYNKNSLAHPLND